MYKNLIQNYAKNLTKDDIITFAKKEGVLVTEEEVDLIYNSIHKDTDKILSKDALKYLEKRKEYLSDKVYNKLVDYYYKYNQFLN